MARMLCVGLPRSLVLNFGPDPNPTRPRFGPGSGVGAELEQWFTFGFGVAPNLAESFGTGSEPQTRR